MEPVSIMILPPWSEPKKDCYLVLFPKVLMVLSVGNEMTSFSYESMLKLEHAQIPVINFADASKQGQDGYAFRLEIQGNSAHPFSDSELILTYMVQFGDEEVWREWYQLLQKQIRLQSVASMTDLTGKFAGVILDLFAMFCLWRNFLFYSLTIKTYHLPLQYHNPFQLWDRQALPRLPLPLHLNLDRAPPSPRPNLRPQCRPQCHLVPVVAAAHPRY